MPETVNPELGIAIVSDSDLPKVLRLKKFFDLDCQVIEGKPLVHVTVEGRK